jgi:hypothetical protein
MPAVIEPTATPEAVAIIATQLPPTLMSEVITVVVTPAPVVTMLVEEMAEVVIAPTLPPAVAPPTPALDVQAVMLFGVIAAAGVLVVLPAGLMVVAYWIGRRL